MLGPLAAGGARDGEEWGAVCLGGEGSAGSVRKTAARVGERGGELRTETLSLGLDRFGLAEKFKR